MTDYKKTLNLPRTTFPMRANLPKNEPRMIEFWKEKQAYARMIQAGSNLESFVLHDGPPYANGHIHLGTAMNKILKDIIVKSQNLRGYKAEYVPGWDCHGLPIELKVEHELGEGKQSLSVLDIRERCRQYALKYLDIQREEFKRLGVLGTWESPYLTMHPSYEAATARELCRFMERGSILRRKKPIHWCPSCETALAEAEVEYAQRTSPSITVRFPVHDAKLADILGHEPDKPVSILIWTTTPWTIPANLAIAVHPEFEYLAVEEGGEIFILAEKLFSQCAELFAWKDPKVVARIPGTRLEHLRAEHPLYGRASHVVLADYVTLETGTGCVHTAPGHGQEDYETGLRYDLDIYAPVNDQGFFMSDVGSFSGQHVFEANPQIIAKLEEGSSLLHQTKLSHSYPHCWRCKKPVIFRATTQWFISMEANDLRGKALEAIDRSVRWIPTWGKQRIRNMIAHRPDWCISRQRAWGVPIIALICEDCGEAFFDAKWVRSVVERFAEHDRGADYWFEAPVDELIPRGLTCRSCSSSRFRKERDILDVWFDSGTSYAAVLEQRAECAYPADMYLEGSDQHRGWFHSSLLASIGTRDRPPYRSVLTHGFVVDGEGKKMSKSLGNVIAPQEIMEQYGAEILRMWTASENYQEDLRISKNILRQLVDNYRRIRNTCRFILGNLNDFDHREHGVRFEHMQPVDRYIVQLLADKHHGMMQAYGSYELHKVFHSLHNACVNELSSFYLDIIKDRLYVLPESSRERRSAQTALYHIIYLLLQDMAPILSFTAEEAYQHLPQPLRGDSETIFGLPQQEYGPVMSAQERRLWDRLLQIRSEVTRAIEPQRKEGIVGHSLDCRVTLYAGPDMFQELNEALPSLRELFIVSQVDLAPLDSMPDTAFRSEAISGLAIGISFAAGDKCARCWNYSERLGENVAYPEACPRCSDILEGLKQNMASK